MTNLKTHIKKLSEEGKQTTQLKLLANSVNKILNDAIDEVFNKVHNDAINKQKGQEVKIMIPSQLLPRLLILLGQKKQETIPKNLKYEKRQIVYLLYRSKNLSKTVYNHLISTI